MAQKRRSPSAETPTNNKKKRNQGVPAGKPSNVLSKGKPAGQEKTPPVTRCAALHSLTPPLTPMAYAPTYQVMSISRRNFAVE
jgi:hypothetical protein